jgi:hypothetical protein
MSFSMCFDDYLSVTSFLLIKFQGSRGSTSLPPPSAGLCKWWGKSLSFHRLYGYEAVRIRVKKIIKF